MSKPKVNYLVCVNKEKYSEVALRFACHVAKRSQGSIILLHVMEPVDYNSLGMVADKMREERRAEGEQLLQDLSEDAKKWADITPVLMFREGLIENEIISVIEEDDTIDVIVVGTAEEGGPKSKVLPPLVSQIGKLHVPMLIVPGSLGKRSDAS